jgi:phosphopantothenoylcysteine decarboxylase/phosphopantothenate--cysteine ligase
MDVHMYEKAVTQENIAKLKARGVVFVGPEHGRLASGLVGLGRLAEVDTIVGAIRKVLGRNGDLAGKRILVTAGGTQEAIDPVRVVTNRSSGKMGYALAEAARDRGAEVVLVTGPTALADPYGGMVRKVISAQQMCQAVLKEVPKVQALIMAAAVADFAPVNAEAQKIKKGTEAFTLQLARTIDILTEVKGPILKVGFAAETEAVMENAQEKLHRKSLDLVVANDVTDKDSGFGADTNRVVIIDREGQVEKLPLLTKYEVAQKVLDRVARLLSSPTTVKLPYRGRELCG